MYRTVSLMLLALLPPCGLGTELSVVASIKPIHALVAGVMEGVGEPQLLVAPGVSPHGHAMKPSEARRLARADVVFWVGQELESFLVKPLATAQGVRNISLLEAPGMTLLPRRGSSAEHAHDHEGSLDPHVWLDPRNASVMVTHIAGVLGETYPTHRPDFDHNASVLVERLDMLDDATGAALEPIKDVPYMVFHDAYQYFAHRYGLTELGVVVTSAERRPGARYLREIRDRIARDNVRCVFSEPQFQPALVATVIEGTDARTAVLDPVGAELQEGSNSYFTLIDTLTRSLRDCLQSKPGKR